MLVSIIKIISKVIQVLYPSSMRIPHGSVHTFVQREQLPIYKCGKSAIIYIRGASFQGNLKTSLAQKEQNNFHKSKPGVEVRIFQSSLL